MQNKKFEYAVGPDGGSAKSITLDNNKRVEILTDSMAEGSTKKVLIDGEKILETNKSSVCYVLDGSVIVREDKNIIIYNIEEDVQSIYRIKQNVAINCWIIHRKGILNNIKDFFANILSMQKKEQQDTFLFVKASIDGLAELYIKSDPKISVNYKESQVKFNDGEIFEINNFDKNKFNTEGSINNNKPKELEEELVLCDFNTYEIEGDIQREPTQ